MICYTYDLLLCVFVRAEEIDCLHMAEVDIVSEQKDKQQLAHILLLLVSV